jgi:hypothetical protein
VADSPSPLISVAANSRSNSSLFVAVFPVANRQSLIAAVLPVVADNLSWLIATPTGLLERLKGATHQAFVAVFQSLIANGYSLPFSRRG